MFSQVEKPLGLTNVSKFNISVKYDLIMNAQRTFLLKNQNFPINGFLNSLYFTFPVGMFLTACNFMFEFVRNYYFNWFIVALPTMAILVVSNVYEAFLVYQKSGKTNQQKEVFISKPSSYTMSKSKLISKFV